MKKFPENKKFQKSNQQIIDAFDYISNTASAQDCTGLIPAGHMDDAQLESYESIYHYQPPQEKCEDK